MTNSSHPKNNKNKASRAGKNRSTKVAISPARLAGLKALKHVFDGQSLSVAQTRSIDNLDDSRDRGLANELVNGVLRWRWRLEFFVSQLLSKSLKAKDRDVQLVLLMALYELEECRTPDYAIISEAVELVRKSGKRWADGLVNAVLRRFTREKEALAAAADNHDDDQVRYSHPRWLLQKIKSDWSGDAAGPCDSSDCTYGWQRILDANNQRPDFWLRVNGKKYSAAQYKQLLLEHGIESSTSEIAEHALKLSQGIDVRKLPGFSEGAVSVQDVGAQLTAELLDLSKDQRLLDLCAAPGGKTCHIIEAAESIASFVVVESDVLRMQRVEENLLRLQLDAVLSPELVVADARQYQQWWNGEAFDRILIDAPCSASGVIRRHPDIKTLRRDTDIEPLVVLQAEILNSAWKMLSVGGEMLYVTCSVFKEENQEQMRSFMAKNKDAEERPIDADWGQHCEFGRQLFPGDFDADGFYFCRIKKQILSDL